MNEQISILYQRTQDNFILSIVKDDDVIVFSEPTEEAERIIASLKNTLQ